MHSFEVLINRSVAFSLSNIEMLESRIEDELQKSGSSRLIVELQMLELQRIILAVGILSIFESYLQEYLVCKDGFNEARQLLKSAGEFQLETRFGQFIKAVNVLKHGRGPSCDSLEMQADILSFRIKDPGDMFFSEGDVSEAHALIKVDRLFIENCTTLINDIMNVLRELKT